MIEALKDDKVINEMGGRFKFTALVQHRIRQLMDGARPLVDRKGRSDFDIAVQEIIEGKITYQLEGGEVVPGMVQVEAPHTTPEVAEAPVQVAPTTEVPAVTSEADSLTAGIEAIAEAAEAAEAEESKPENPAE
ncbi:DNA-directed RNA polymerase subunit omega [Planctomycetota bacterium]|nr:DNA-directed RNA polymerase subunit omega [Planctomycetota bacterium]